MEQLERLQTELWILATRYPSDEVRRLAMEVPSTLLPQRLGSTLLYANARLGSNKEQEEPALADAEAKGTEARKTLADLLAAIQGANVATKPIEL